MLNLDVATVEVLQTRSSLVNGLMNHIDVSDRPIMIFAPGNPGFVYFYDEFVEEMDSIGLDCVVIGFAGHSVSELNNNLVFDLQNQIELVHEFFVKAEVALRKRRACHVGGHSIGAYIAVHMLARFPHLLKRGFLLAPTLCNLKDSPNGKRNKKFLTSNVISFLSWTCKQAARAPTALQEAAIRYFCPAVNNKYARIATRMARANFVRNVLHLAASEFAQLCSLDLALLQQVQHRIVAYYVKVDGWVPRSDVELFSRSAPSAIVVLEEDDSVLHAWVLHSNRTVVANGISRFVHDVPVEY